MHTEMKMILDLVVCVGFFSVFNTNWFIFHNMDDCLLPKRKIYYSIVVQLLCSYSLIYLWCEWIKFGTYLLLVRWYCVYCLCVECVCCVLCFFLSFAFWQIKQTTLCQATGRKRMQRAHTKTHENWCRLMCIDLLCCSPIWN